MRVLVNLDGPHGRRVASLLADSPDVEAVAMYGRAVSEVPMAEDPADWDVLVGEPLDEWSSLRVSAEHGPVDGGVSDANTTGLALAVAAFHRGAELVGVTADGEVGEVEVRFPPPLGSRGGVEVDATGLPTERLVKVGVIDGLGGFLVQTKNERLALVDDSRFLDAITLAAAVGLPPGPVWEHAEEYLQRAEKLGLVVAESG